MNADKLNKLIEKAPKDAMERPFEVKFLHLTKNLTRHMDGNNFSFGSFSFCTPFKLNNRVM